MSARKTLLILALVGTLPACSQDSPVRIATANESRAIIASLVPDSPSGLYCISRELQPPLADQRAFQSINFERSWWERTREWLTTALSSEDHGETPWMHWNDAAVGAEGSPLEKKEADRLDRFLNEATQADLSRKPMPISFPNQIAACTKDNIESDEGGGPSPIRITYSRPVLIADVALVEVGVVCGTLCGNGNVTALTKRGGKWAILGEKASWIS